MPYQEPGTITRLLSTISSPAFSEVVVVYRDTDIYDLTPRGWRHRESLIPAPFYKHFEALREMHKARAFQLVLYIDVWDHPVADGVRSEQAAAEERGKTGLGDFVSESLVIPSSHRSNPIFPAFFAYGYRRPWSIR